MIYKIASNNLYTSNNLEKEAFFGTALNIGKGLVNAFTKGVSSVGARTVNMAKNGVGEKGFMGNVKSIGKDIQSGYNQQNNFRKVNLKHFGTGAAVLGTGGLVAKGAYNTVFGGNNNPTPTPTPGNGY